MSDGGEGLDFNYGIWFGDDGRIAIRMPDRVFQRHVKARLQERGLPTETASEAMDRHAREMTQIDHARKSMIDELRGDVSYWESCGDDEVIVRTLARIIPPL